MSSKKLLVCVSHADFKCTGREFLVPQLSAGRSGFMSVESSSCFPYGLVAYTGNQVIVEDILDRMRASGQPVESLSTARKILELYLERLQGFRIGNILGIAYNDDALDFSLNKLADKQEGEVRKRPRLP